MESKQVMAVLLGCLCITSAGAAGTAGAPMTQTVEELIRLDAQDAVKAARQKTMPTLPSTDVLPVKAPMQGVPKSGKPIADKDVITVSAIYGYGDNLRAVVSVNGQAQAALKEGEQFAGYELDKVSGRCVTLKPLHVSSKSATHAKADKRSKREKGSKPTAKAQAEDEVANAPITRCYAARQAAPNPAPTVAGGIQQMPTGLNGLNSLNGFSLANGAMPPSLPVLQVPPTPVVTAQPVAK